MDFAKSAIENIAIVGQLLLFYFLIRGPFRRYYLVFSFVVIEMLGDYVAKYVGSRWGLSSTQYANTYYGAEACDDLSLFIVLILLTYQLMGDNPLRAKVRKMLMVVAAGTVVVPFALFSSQWFTSRWYNNAAQLLNFGGAVITLGLWAAIIALRTRDRQLMLVCAGLGIATAGNAALWGMRRFTHAHTNAREIAGMLIQAMYLVRLGIWCWAFRPRQAPAPPPAPAKSYAS